MKRKVVLLFALCIVLILTSCAKNNGLKGTSWAIEIMGIETGYDFSDTKATPYSMSGGSKITEGSYDYTFKDNKVEISFDGMALFSGTIKDDIMTLKMPFMTMEYKKK